MGTRDVETVRPLGAAIAAVIILIGGWTLRPYDPAVVAGEPPPPTASDSTIPVEPEESSPSSTATTEPVEPEKTSPSSTATTEPVVAEPDPSVSLEAAESSESSSTSSTTTTTVHGHSGGQGNPTQIVFEVAWRSVVDAMVTALDNVLPADWRDAFVVTGAGETGSGHDSSAICVYPTSGGDLTCTYDSRNHGDDDGLVVRARPDATYLVNVDGVPAGWTLDDDTVGTFVGRVTCPRGDGGHSGGGGSHTGGSHTSGDDHTDDTHSDDGHTGGSHTGGSGGQGDGGQQYICTHTVTIDENLTTTTTSSTTTTTTSSVSTTSSVPTTSSAPAAATSEPNSTAAPSSVASAAGGAETLPTTGSATTWTSLIAMALITVGMVLLRTSRRPVRAIGQG